MTTNKTIAYYNQLGSRIGYKLVAGGHRHFGYYRDKNYWYIPHAAIAMIDHLAEYAEIKPGERVLDAGCGEGRASLRIAQKYGAEVSGVDLVPRSIAIAKKRVKNARAKVDYQIANFNKLPFKDGTFDVVFTLETFTHTDNPLKTLTEFLRVLKPGGRIVLFDYSISKAEDATPEFATTVKHIAKYTNCPGFEIITHDYYDEHLPKAGVTRYEVLNETDTIMRSLRQIYILSWLAYQLLKLFNRVDHHPNLLISHFGKEGAEKGYFHYVNVKIWKPEGKVRRPY